MSEPGAITKAFNRGQRTPAEIAALNDLLFKAAARGTAADIKRLVAEGAQVDAVDQDGFVPLHKAVFASNTDTVKALGRCGADINAQDSKLGFTPLHWAVVCVSHDAALALVDLGADCRVRDFEGKSLADILERSSKENGIAKTVHDAISLRQSKRLKKGYLARKHSHAKAA